MDTDTIMRVDNSVSLEIDSSDAQPTKRRKKSSMVWDHFTVETASPGTTKACCKHCNKSYAYKSGAKTAGTSHLKRHIELGICPMSPGISQVPRIKNEPTSGPPKIRQRSSGNVPIDQDRCNHEIAKMIIMHDYPLHMVEHPGFTGFVKALNPKFVMASYNTIHADCVTTFLSQKQKLSDLIGEIPGAVNLTVDLWSSNQSMGYAFVTGHFLDKDWNLTHCLLNVSLVASPDSDFALNQPVAACLSDWKLEGKISSLTVSQSLVNKTSIDNLRGFLSVRNQHVLNGQLLMGKCYARLLGSMAQDSLAAEQLQAPIKKVRESIKYIKTNEACRDKFEELKRRLETPSNRELLIDNQTKWNTSYNMLLAAYEHRQVFSCLETCYPAYKIAISPEEWRKIESLCSCLKVLFEAANVLTGPNHLTANDLYHEMTNLQIELSHAAMGEDPDVRILANPMKEKFDLYWRGCFLVLAVAIVLDPRFKMHLIEFSFSKSYGEEAEKWIKTVGDAVHELYLNYSEHNLLDAYVDRGFSETDVAHEPHFHQDVPQYVNTGNGQSGDKTIPQVEETTDSHPIEEEAQQLGDDSQTHPIAEEDHTSFTVEKTTEPHQHERHIKVEKQNKVELWEGVNGERQLTEEDPQLDDNSQAHPIGEEEMQLDDDSQAHQIGEDAQELGADSQDHTMGEEEPQLDDDSQAHQMGEEDQQLGDDSQAHAIGEEEQQLGDDSQPGQLGEEEQQLDDNSQACQIGEEEQQLGGDSQAHPIGEEDQQLDDNSRVHQLGEEDQRMVDSQAHQIGEEDQQLVDDTQPHPVGEEDHTTFMGDVLLQEGSTLVTIGDSLSDFEIYISDIKTELDQYLEDTLIPRSEEFNVLSWWRLNRSIYPTLSKMAADILSISFSTVSPDSVFDTEVKQMGNYETSLPHVTLEALLCTKDWLKNQTL